MSEDSYPCGCKRSTTARLLERAEPLALCTGKPLGCGELREHVIVYLADPGQGFHVLAPLTIEASCRRHRRSVRARAARHAAPGARVEVRPFADLAAICGEFHESGLCAGRAISIATPGART